MLRNNFENKLGIFGDKNGFLLVSLNPESFGKIGYMNEKAG